MPKMLVFPFCTCTSSIPLPFLGFWTVLSGSLGICLLSLKMATPNDKVLFWRVCCKSSQFFCRRWQLWLFECSYALLSLWFCHGLKARQSIWFLPPHFGCLGKICPAKSSRSCWKVYALLSMYHITQSCGHSAHT